MGRPENQIWSLPAWGAWIEIIGEGFFFLSPYRRSPHGERGLKFCQLRRDGGGKVSLPAWGAWIEIMTVKDTAGNEVVAPRMGSVD